MVKPSFVAVKRPKIEASLRAPQSETGIASDGELGLAGGNYGTIFDVALLVVSDELS